MHHWLLGRVDLIANQSAELHLDIGPFPSELCQALSGHLKDWGDQEIPPIFYQPLGEQIRIHGLLNSFLRATIQLLAPSQMMRQGVTEPVCRLQQLEDTGEGSIDNWQCVEKWREFAYC